MRRWRPWDVGGRPQLSTVCFLASGDATVQLSLNATRQKTRNMIDHSQVALHIIDTAQPGRYVELRGDATVEPDDDYAFADRSERSTAASICATWIDRASAAPWSRSR